MKHLNIHTSVMHMQHVYTCALSCLNAYKTEIKMFGSVSSLENLIGLNNNLYG